MSSLAKTNKQNSKTITCIAFSMFLKEIVRKILDGVHQILKLLFNKKNPFVYDVLKKKLTHIKQYFLFRCL